ncbi:methionyl-tRNA formyltransferase [Marinospirillum insulare]|uniref:Formyl transferase n=1 Tax=Marinospirillum insulare TaxID=217169 RepID=A0ABQ5ZSV7_9GAMM|nr:formyltransferase family protein [Marinospirillum insulare]GLR63049.1 formyl transferase [Marinospirillum insulare]
MKIGFIGCVQSSYKALETLLTLKAEKIEVVAVVTKQQSVVNADFVDLAPLCKDNNIPFHYENPSQKELSLTFLKKHKPDVIYCFGWSYLLDKETLDLASYGAIGYHPAPLPKARGRHPIIWALALGLKETASTFFKMDEGADSGPILSQEIVTIEPEDNATSLYTKLLTISTEQIIEFSRALASKTARFSPQDPSKATYWRKRTRADGLIDWRMQADSIHNLVRALSPPYPGAEFVFHERHLILQKTYLTETTFSKHIEPGRILELDNTKVLVKCADTSALWIEQPQLAESIKVGDYL